MLTDDDLLLAAECVRATANYGARAQGRDAEADARPPCYVRADEKIDPDALWRLADKLYTEVLRR